MDPGNPETFEHFMARALHDPVRGYYARNIRGIGARGDFTTAPQLSEAPGEAIAGWVAEALRETGTRHVIEIGPGLGTLSGQVMRRLPFTLRLRTRFHLVESSPALAKRQAELLGKKVSHHTRIHGALAACSGNAVIFSNELVDAFPCRLFEKSNGEWREVALVHSSGQPAEILLPPAGLPPSSAFKLDFPDGQRVEIHDSYRLWLESWLPGWKRGKMLTIDYGTTAETLYHRRPGGSLRAYFLHQRSCGAEIYQNPGLRDITADVNFTDLSQWPAAWLGARDPEALGRFIRRYTAAGGDHLMEAAGNFMALSQERL
ncbi:SAM-dependent methyltransferase [Akkermansiaceae bacterium]|nr:SAM-dependent methyltransferase [Akkermansiaceae bacterium]